MTGCSWLETCTVCWRSAKARVRAAAALWPLLALGAANAAGLPVALAEAPPPSAADTGLAQDACKEPLCYTASRLEAERNRMVLYDINIVDTTRGITHIKADLAEATGEDLGNSAWVLTGHVQASLPQGKLRADRATIQFVNKRITLMTAQGAPAEFERNVDHSVDSPAPGDGANRSHNQIDNAHGHAREIDYDLEHDLLTLKGDSWLTDGCNEINSQSIVYDITNQKVRAEVVPGDDTQVHGTLHSRTGTQCASGAAHP
jgi:lipopolysaccharide transport protein LptA